MYLVMGQNPRTYSATVAKALENFSYQSLQQLGAATIDAMHPEDQRFAPSH